MLLRLVIVAVLAATACAQSLTVVPPSQMKARREALERAYETWRQTEPNLESELFTESADIIDARIEHAAERAEAFSRARQGYYEVLITDVRGQLRLLEQPLASIGLEGVGEKAVLEHKLQALTDNERELQRALEKAPTDGRGTLIREQIRQQLNAAAQLRQNLAAQSQTAIKLGETEGKFEQNRRALATSYDSLLRVFEGELARARGEDKLWRDYYDGLRQAVDDHAPSKPKTAAKSSPSRKVIDNDSLEAERKAK